MLSYLECEINDTEVVAYLESQPPQYLPCPFNYCFPGEIPRGREFLRYCKFGTLQVILTSSNSHFHHSYFTLWLQYCVIRPATAIIAMILGQCSPFLTSPNASNTAIRFIWSLSWRRYKFKLWIFLYFIHYQYLSGVCFHGSYDILHNIKDKVKAIWTYWKISLY